MLNGLSKDGVLLVVMWLSACNPELGVGTADLAVSREALTVAALLAPAPTQPLNTYDFFGQRLTSAQAFSKVLGAGQNPFDPNAYARLGLVSVNALTITEGHLVFDNAVVGDNLGFQRVFGFKDGIAVILPELLVAILQLNGRPTTNLRITLQKDVTIGHTVLRRGSTLDTGLDVEAGALLPIGLRADANITCAICHATLDASGRRVEGVPNSDLNAAALVAIAPNTASVLGRLTIDVNDPALYTAGTGKQIIDSHGRVVRLPDPEKLEALADDVVLQVPAGHFESSIDRISNTTEIPSVFTWGTNVFTFDGAFQAGPFRGLTSVSSSVHSSEVNIIANAFDSALLDVDPEVYKGLLLKNAADPTLRLPATPVKPSAWLRTQVPDASQGELEGQVIAPGSGPYPNLKPTLATFNGLVWSPSSGQLQFGSGPYLRGANAMAAFQDSLLPPPNRSAANQSALASGAVARGAQVFLAAGCASCHVAPFFTDNKVYPNAQLGMNGARAESRLALDGRMSPPKVYAFDEAVPLRADARVLEVPIAGISDDPARLPFGTRDRGYKTLSLRGLFASAPYFHDGGAAVGTGTLRIAPDGSWAVVDPNGLGIPGAVQSFRGVDAAGSLRAVVDSALRDLVVSANRASPGLVRQSLDGSGHRFFVDATTGFTPRQQADLVDFLLALDDNPGAY